MRGERVVLESSVDGVASHLADQARGIGIAVSESAERRWQRLNIPEAALGELGAAGVYAQILPMTVLSALRLFPACSWEVRLRRLTAVHPVLGTLLLEALSGDDEVARLTREIAEWLERQPLDAILGEEGLVRFFEPFLRHFDASLRRRRGVYYTPKPLARFMVQSLDELLRDELGLALGLASAATWSEVQRGRSSLRVPRGLDPGSPFLRILDPCTGTGTFLLEVVTRVRATWLEEIQAGRRSEDEWADYVYRLFLPNLHGRELMPASLWICELQLVAALAATGLDPLQCAQALRLKQGNTLAEEDLVADGFTVILGNPPYSALSENMAPAFAEQVHPYRWCDGESLGERKTWLQDDYVKFVRFAERSVLATGIGATCLVTPHGYLDTPTFRGMRRSLLDTYQGIWILDLHGNSLRGERAGDGRADPNLFGIRQGVSVQLTLRDGGQSRCAHAGLLAPVGREAGRVFKRDWLSTQSWSSVSWTRLKPEATPYYFFYPLEAAAWEEYQEFVSLTETMPLHCTGIVTARDRFVFDEQPERLLERVGELRGEALSDAQIRERYFQGKGSNKYPPGDSRGWKLPEARQRLRGDDRWRERLRLCLYRPFDLRHLYYTKGMVDWPRQKLMSALDIPGNRLLITVRQLSQRGGSWSHVAVSDQLVESCAISNKTREINYCFPMLYRDDSGAVRPNFSREFMISVKEAVGEHSVSDLYDYVLALLSSAAYRSRYSAFLRFDFPRLVLPRERALFETLAALGRQLSAAYLDHQCRRSLTTRGSLEVGKLRFEEGRVLLGRGGAILGIPRPVWEYRVGSYQVCAKWLGARKGRCLGAQELGEFGGVVARIEELIRVGTEIDACLLPEDFLAHGRLHAA
jgi:hypothetical protein